MRHTGKEHFLAFHVTLQTSCHLIDRFAETADFVAALFIHVNIEMPLGNLRRGAGH